MGQKSKPTKFETLSKLIAHLSQNQEFYHLIVIYLKEDMEEELEFLNQIKLFSNQAKILVILNYMQYSDIVKFFEAGVFNSHLIS